MDRRSVAGQTDKLNELKIDRTAEGRSRQGSAKVWLVTASVLLAALAGFFLWRTLGARGNKVVRTAPVREVVTGAGDAVLDASGYVTARRKATVSSKVTGKISGVMVEEGMVVSEGQVLARLDDAIQAKSLALAEAQLVSARRAREETRVRLEEAKINLGRIERLVEQLVDSRASLDTAQAEVDSLEARLALGEEEVNVAERIVIVRRQELEDTIIRAPFDGVAISKDAQPGEMVSPVSAGGGFTRTGICTIVDMASLEIEVDVNEAYINRVRPDQRVEAVLDAYPEWRIPGKVITTVPAADRQKATVRVRIAFDELEPRILPDMGVKVTFLGSEEKATDSAKSRLIIPRAAMRREAGRDMVFVLQGDHVESRGVTLGAASGSDVEVVEGLSVGERVVVEGAEDLADGDIVVER